MAESLFDRLKKAGSLHTEVVSKSAFFKPKAVTQIPIPIFNVANSGSLDGGLASGVNIIAGPSRHFKTTLALVQIKAYMDKYKDALVMFYDSEFGVTLNSLIASGCDKDRMFHIPILHIEQLKFDIVQKLKEVKVGDHVLFFVDSLGNLASKKEVEDAENENEAADMTRAKAIKSLFRIITPHFTIKDIPAIIIAHTYDEQKMYGKTIVSGGTGVMLSANNVWVIGRSQEKEGTEVTGYNFTINIEKSRFVREKSKFEFQVLFNGGINRWSGLLELAIESGHVVKPKNGWYAKVDTSTGEIDGKNYREIETENALFWTSILKDKKYHEFVRNKYQLAVNSLQQEDKVIPLDDITVDEVGEDD